MIRFCVGGPAVPETSDKSLRRAVPKVPVMPDIEKRLEKLMTWPLLPVDIILRNQAFCGVEAPREGENVPEKELPAVNWVAGPRDVHRVWAEGQYGTNFIPGSRGHAYVGTGGIVAASAEEESVGNQTGYARSGARILPLH